MRPSGGRGTRQQDEKIRAHRGKGGLNLGARTRTNGHHGNYGSYADDDAQSGQKGPHRIAQKRAKCDSKRHQWIHAIPSAALAANSSSSADRAFFGGCRSSESNKPSLTTTTREAKPAMSGS